MRTSMSFVGYSTDPNVADRPYVANVYLGNSAIHRCFATEAAAQAYVDEWKARQSKPMPWAGTRNLCSSEAVAEDVATVG